MMSAGPGMYARLSLPAFGFILDWNLCRIEFAVRGPEARRCVAGLPGIVAADLALPVHAAAARDRGAGAESWCGALAQLLMPGPCNVACARRIHGYRRLPWWQGCQVPPASTGLCQCTRRSDATTWTLRAGSSKLKVVGQSMGKSKRRGGISGTRSSYIGTLSRH